jgi:hypothetical protein
MATDSHGLHGFKGKAFSMWTLRAGVAGMRAVRPSTQVCANPRPGIVAESVKSVQIRG